MAKKWLYTFTINKETEVEKREKSTKDGKDIETVEKVKETAPVEFLLQKPTRKLFDEAELFYGVKMSEGIKAGLLTRNLLAKRYEDDGGAFSEVEKQRYSELYLAIYNKEEEYQRLQLNLDNKSQELKDKLAQDLLYELSDLRRELTEIENAQANIFDQTAENRAKNQTIMWWVLKLSNWKEHSHNDASPFFGTGTHEERLAKYDEFEEEMDDFYGEAIRKLAYFVSFWYMGRATSEEEFKTVEELYDSQQPELEDEDLDEVAEATEAEESLEEPAKKTKKTKPAAKKRGRKPKAKKQDKAEDTDKETVAKEEAEPEVAEVEMKEEKEPVAEAKSPTSE